MRAYTELHALGFAHSLEVWRGQDLAGGLYGIKLGTAFFGESMFTRITDGSKTALLALSWLAERGELSLIDCQVENPHLVSLGARNLAREDFENRLDAAITALTPETAEQVVEQASYAAGQIPQWAQALPDKANALMEDQAA